MALTSSALAAARRAAPTESEPALPPTRGWRPLLPEVDRTLDVDQGDHVVGVASPSPLPVAALMRRLSCSSFDRAVAADERAVPARHHRPVVPALSAVPGLAHVVVDLVAVPEPVDQPGLERLGGEQRRPVDQVEHLVDVEPAAGGDPGHQLLHRRRHQPLGGLPVGLGEPLLGEHVGRI